MIDRLPYTLTTGVTATREGLIFRDEGLFCYVAEIGSDEELFQSEKMYDGMFDNPIMAWPDVAERLRYREGEPWCRTSHGVIECWSGECMFDDELILHRLAAILCDDAEAFRVLHWCVEKLSGSTDEKEPGEYQ